MNYTENVQLPQWVETDRIMMADFNEAMAKVDQGIEEVENRISAQKVAGQTLKEAAAQITFDLDQLDLSQYSQLEFCVRGAIAPSGKSLCLQVNGDGEENYDYKALGSSMEYTSNAWPICGNFGDNTAVKGSILPAGTEGNLVIQWSALGYSNTFPSFSLYGGLHKALLFPELTSLRFFPTEGNLTKGTAITIYGLRQ